MMFNWGIDYLFCGLRNSSVLNIYSPKSNIYKSRTKLKNIKVSNLFPGANAATRAAGYRIFLHENLTSYRKKRVNRASEMRRDEVLLSAWTLDGKVYVKTSPEGRSIKINDLEDLESL